MSEPSQKGRRGRRRVRWAIGIVSGVLVIAGAVGLGPVSPARADVEPGVGSSYAQSLQITPHEGSLAVGVVYGEALAGHTNKVARTQSQGEDLGSIGLSLEGYNCGQQPSAQQVALIPQALQAETPAKQGAKDEKTLKPTDGLTTASPTSWPPSWGSTEHVLADGTPYGQADTSYGELDGGSGFTISGTYSKAWTGLVDGQRVAAATSDIGVINLAGQVVLKGLHWEAVYPSGGSGQPKGSFSIGQLTIGGQAVPTGDPSAAIAAANQALSQLGIQLNLPQIQTVQGVQFVSPLEFDWVPNTNRDKVVRTVTVPAQQQAHPLEDGLETGFSPSEPAQLVQALCQTDTPITVADITIAAFTGGGFFNMALGGVNATSGDLPANQYDLSKFQPTSVAGLSQTSAGTAALAGTAGTPGTASLGTDAASLGGGGQAKGAAGGARRPLERAAAVSHTSGPLLAIGLGGLGLLALLAEGDRRMMRRAHKHLAFEFEE